MGEQISEKRARQRAFSLLIFAGIVVACRGCHGFLHAHDDRRAEALRLRHHHAAMLR